MIWKNNDNDLKLSNTYCYVVMQGFEVLNLLKHLKIDHFNLCKFFR